MSVIVFEGGFKNFLYDLVCVFCVLMNVMVWSGLKYEVMGVLLLVFMFIVVGVLLLMFCDGDIGIYLMFEFDIEEICIWISFYIGVFIVVLMKVDFVVGCWNEFVLIDCFVIGDVEYFDCFMILVIEGVGFEDVILKGSGIKDV